MRPNIRKIMVSTSGGDAPGLNAVIRALVKRAILGYGWEVVGSTAAYNGVMADPMDLIPLDMERVSGLLIQGGTILGTTNRGGPFEFPVQGTDGQWTTEDRSEDLIKRIRSLGVDAVVSIGGEGSQAISQKLFEKGLPIVGVPKTIDNDLSATDMTFGFQTAVETATEAVDKLHTTAASHDRVMILEVMGRDAGWIALASGIAGGADVILIPEIPYDIAKVVERVTTRQRGGIKFSIVVVAEGAYPKEGVPFAQESNIVGRRQPILGGVGRWLVKQIQEATGHETRVTVLGHLQRGGVPCPPDRILATQFGVAAADLVAQGKFGHMVALQNQNIVGVPLTEAIRQYKYVNLDHHLVHTARGLGVCLGD